MKRSIILLLLLSIHLIGWTQYPIYAPTTTSSKLALNASYAGVDFAYHKFGINGLLVQNRNDLSYTVDGSYMSYLKKIHGSIGGVIESDLLNPFNHKYSATALYTYSYRINRKLTLLPTMAFRYSTSKTNLSNYYLRYDFNERDSITPIGTSQLNNFNLQGSILLYGRNFQIGYQLSNLLSSPVAKVGDTNLIAPFLHSMVLSFDRKLTRALMLNIFLNGQYQSVSYTDKKHIESYFPGTAYLYSALNLKSSTWSYGLGYRLNPEQTSTYHLQLGKKIRQMELFYNFGINPKMSGAGQVHQISAQYNLSSKSKPVAFRTISCPSFGGPPVVGHRYSLSRSKGYSQKTKINNTPTPVKQISMLSTAKHDKKPQEPEIKAGTLTAGEINDFAKWDLWQDIQQDKLSSYRSKWSLDPHNRVCVRVLDSLDHAVQNAEVVLFDQNGKEIWKAKTDNTGKAELWANIDTNSRNVASYLTVEKGEHKRELRSVTEFKSGINDIRISAPCSISNKVDIGFVVDATGSMGDEIKYLKEELLDIIDRLKSGHEDMEFRLASLFYRCAGNSYVTKAEDLTTDIRHIHNFIKAQNADEGGDEAVEIALKESVENFSWDPTANARLLFLVLDEPPGNKDSIRTQLYESMRLAAEKGIRIIPLVASGTAYGSDKSLEYLMRSIALCTNGTYAFLTNHSGVGNDHTEPEIDEYDVELMNELILRLIDQFITMRACQGPPFFDVVTKDSATLEVIHQVNVFDTLTVVTYAQDSIEIRSDSLVPLIKDAITTISFYPNPSRGMITIQNDVEIDAVYLTDKNGKILQRIPLNKGQTSIDLSYHPAGTYYLQYHGQKRKFESRLILLK